MAKFLNNTISLNDDFSRVNLDKLVADRSRYKNTVNNLLQKFAAAKWRIQVCESIPASLHLIETMPRGYREDEVPWINKVREFILMNHVKQMIMFDDLTNFKPRTSSLDFSSVGYTNQRAFEPYTNNDGTKQAMIALNLVDLETTKNILTYLRLVENSQKPNSEISEMDCDSYYYHALDYVNDNIGEQLIRYNELRSTMDCPAATQEGFEKALLEDNSIKRAILNDMNENARDTEKRHIELCIEEYSYRKRLGLVEIRLAYLIDYYDGVTFDQVDNINEMTQDEKVLLALSMDVGWGNRENLNAAAKCANEQYKAAMEIIKENPLEHTQSANVGRKR